MNLVNFSQANSPLITRVVGLFCHWFIFLREIEQLHFSAEKPTTRVISGLFFWEKFCNYKRHFEAIHWNLSKLTHSTGYFDEVSASYPRENTFRNLSIYRDPNDSLQSVVYSCQIFLSVVRLLIRPIAVRETSVSRHYG